jgi:hypothetical protein
LFLRSFPTNNFALPALQNTQLYKCRWQFELFSDVTLFENTPIHQALAQLPDQSAEGEACNHSLLFD